MYLLNKILKKENVLLKTVFQATFFFLGKLMKWASVGMFIT